MARKRKRPSMQLQNRLPNDIFLEILERLPVNSLVRFMTVSKSWKASIRNPSFISSNHHRHHDESRSCSHLVLMAEPYWHPVQTCYLIPETSSTPIPNYNPVLKIKRRATIVGSSEGLICFKSTSVLFLWNPFIRTNLKKVCGGEIPLDTESKRGLRFGFTPESRIVLGFGFAPKSRDHRVVKLVSNDDHLSEVEIYSLASDSWRRIKPPPTRFKYMDDSRKVIFNSSSSYSSSIYLDGSIYWLLTIWGWAIGDRRSYLILRFDLEEERFEEISGQSYGSDMAPRLAVINGFLVVWNPVCISGYWTNKVQAYIYKESNSGSSSWEAKSFDLPEIEEIFDGRVIGGHNIVGTNGSRVSVYYGSCDGKNLSFKLKNLSFKLKDLGYGAEIRKYIFIPTKKTLFLLDKK